MIHIAAAAAAIVATPAFAADFAGPYVGAGITLDNVQGSGALEGLGFSGVGATAFGGYNLPLGGSTFAGVEANVDLNTADAAGIEAKWGWGVGARFGYKLNEGTALYARAGYARSKIAAFGFSDWGDGVRYGAGIETGVTDRVSLRAEFTQTNYESDIINNQGTLGVVFGF
ncbi:MULTISPECIES: outer membrane protein [unclassified Sphingomonas]|uniref:outer membrane protein n=1 Tax=unclassified Sphingomonas TaxID=196159 RepID=UPI000B02B0D3|nr:MULTISPECIES: outer membrane beta-barrel protein [unclassified Sphingomonas]